VYLKSIQTYLLKFGQDFALVLKGAFFNVLTNVLGSVLSFLSSLLIARYFGSSVLGTVAIVSAILGMANLIANFGFSNAIVRLIPEYKNQGGMDGAYAVYQKIFTLRMVFIIITTGVYLLLVDWLESMFFANSPYPMKLVLWSGGIVVLLGTFYGNNLQTIRGLKYIASYNLLEVAPRVIFLLLVFAVIMLSKRPVDIIYAKLVGDVISAVLAMMLMA